MTLLSIATMVADSVGLPRPASVATGQDQLSRQMFALANEVLEDASKLDWPVLERQYSFQTGVDIAQYALPADFARELSDSAYLSSQYYALRGSMSPGDWARNRYALPSQIGRYKFRIYGFPLALNFTPTPKTVETVVYEYVTTMRVRVHGASADTLATNYQFDDDVSLVPEDVIRKGLKWKIKHAKGLDYSEDFNDYVTAKSEALAQQLALGSVPVAMRHMIDIPEVPNGFIPEFGFGS